MAEPKRSLWPREHGAYAQLGAPIAGALLLSRPTPAALLLALAAFGAFLANEPLLVVLGQRGRRMLETSGYRARLRLLLLGFVTTASGVAGLYMAGPATLRMAATVLIPALGLVVLAWKRAQHSLVGELVAACALPGASAPVAVAAGVDTGVASMMWLAWSLGYAATVLAVHRVIARHRSPANRIDRAIAIVLGGALAAIASAGGPFQVLRIGLPLVAISAVLVARPPRASRLRAVGVALVVASVASIALTVTVA